MYKRQRRRVRRARRRVRRARRRVLIIGRPSEPDGFRGPFCFKLELLFGKAHEDDGHLGAGGGAGGVEPTAVLSGQQTLAHGPAPVSYTHLTQEADVIVKTEIDKRRRELEAEARCV